MQTQTETRRLDILGVELEWQLRSADTHDRYCVLSALVPPGVGIPPHQHPQQEAFFVLEGEAEFAVNDISPKGWTRARPGEMVNIPPNVMHGFRNVSDRTVKVLITCEPGLGDFFEDAGRPLELGASSCTHPTPEDIQRVIAIAEKHGQRFAPPA